MLKDRIQVWMDHVIVWGVRIERPPDVGRTVWAKYWQRLEKAQDDYDERYN